MDHVNEDDYQQVCTAVDALVAETGLDMVIGHVGDLNQRWNRTTIFDHRRWTVWINNAATRNGHIVRLDYVSTKDLATLAENLTIDKLRDILRHAFPKAICDRNGNTIVTYEESAKLILIPEKV